MSTVQPALVERVLAAMPLNNTQLMTVIRESIVSNQYELQRLVHLICIEDNRTRASLQKTEINMLTVFLSAEEVLPATAEENPDLPQELRAVKALYYDRYLGMRVRTADDVPTRPVPEWMRRPLKK